jgi:hypothetical protein
VDHDEPQLSLPRTWYAYGDAVLDAICGTVRADHMTVATPATGLTGADVRRALKRELNVVISSAPHRVMCTVDAIVLTPDGRFFDLLTGDYILRPEWPLRLMPLTPSLTARDALRLRYVIDTYPELQVDDKFYAKIQADIAFLQGYKDISADLAMAFLEYHIRLER